MKKIERKVDFFENMLRKMRKWVIFTKKMKVVSL